LSAEAIACLERLSFHKVKELVEAGE
jgi:hypothetical protein